MNRIYWLTGLPSSGKTTIAENISKRINVEIVDGDDLRTMTANEGDFSYEGRRSNMLTAAYIAHRLSGYTDVVVALVSPIRAVREEIRSKYPNVIEIHVKCGLSTCIQRDLKGTYNKLTLDVMQSPDFYEKPFRGVFTVDNEASTADECAELILKRYHERGGQQVAPEDPVPLPHFRIDGLK